MCLDGRSDVEHVAAVEPIGHGLPVREESIGRGRDLFVADDGLPAQVADGLGRFLGHGYLTRVRAD